MATKPIQFKEDFISQITEGGVSRGDALSSSTLADVQANRTDIPETVVQQRVKFINDLGFGDITLGDIKQGGAKRDSFVKALIAHGSDTKSKALIGDFTKILGEVGVTLARGANPFRAMMKEAVGESDYLKAGFSTVVDRKIPLAYPPEVYTEVKKTVSGLLTSKDPVRRAAGTRMLLMMQGGYRPSDFKGLKVENINFETGIVKGLDLKTDSKTNVEGAGKKSVPIAYMPASQRDVISQHIAGKSSGLVFENPDKLDKIINEELAKAKIPEIEYYSEKTGDYVKEKFSAYDFRRLNETHLSAAGYAETSTVRRALTWRPQEGNVQKYQAVLNEAGRIEQANAAAFQTWVLMSDGNAVESNGQRVRTHGQFLTEVGIKNISPYTARYSVTSSAVNNLPPFMQEKALQLSQGVAFSNDNIASLPINTDAKAASTFQQISQTEMETKAVEAETALRKAKTELEQTPVPSAKPSPDLDDVDPAPNPEARARLLNRGFDPKGMADALVDFMGKAGKKTTKIVGGALALETARQFVEAPLQTGAAIAKDIGLEAAGRAAGLGLGPAAAVPMILEPSELASGELRPEGEEYTVEMLPETTVRQREVDRIVREDTGMIPEPDRVPQAAPVQDQGFISR